MTPVTMNPTVRAISRSCAASAIILCTLLASACGNANHGGSTELPAGTADTRTASGASAAAGTATDAGLNQLYVGGSIALRELPGHGPVSDGNSGVNEIIRSLNNVRPEPVTGAGMITSTTYANPIVVSGSISYSSDTNGLPANWYHVSLDFSSTSPFTITTDEGDRAAITGGQINLYVLNTDGADDSAGNWSRTVDSYVVIPATSPVTVVVTLTDGTVRTSSLTGERHVNRVINRTVSGTTVSRSDGVTIDGTVAPVPITPALANGPGLVDRNGTGQVFTQWNNAVQIDVAGGINNHTFVWDRYCTYTVSYSYQVGTLVWSGAISNYVENVYVTLDGVQVGPLSDLQLYVDYALLHDLNRSGGQY
jgi:hypothetical protein